jgi:hypothetical protein
MRFVDLESADAFETESRVLVSSSFPIPAALNQSTLTRESLRGCIDGLWQALEPVTDPRDRRGVRYPLPLLLILALLAATAGAKTFLETAEHAAGLTAWLITKTRGVSLGGTSSGWTFELPRRSSGSYRSRSRSPGAR